MFEHQYHELIVVDQTREHDTKTGQYLDSLINNGKIIYLFVDYPNLPNARNTGIKRASGDIILFLDDDVEITGDFIPAHTRGFAGPDTGCVTGKVTIRNADKHGNIVLGNGISLKKTIKRLLFFLLRGRASYTGPLGILSNFDCGKTVPADTCIGCNMSFRKEVFDVCGMFDDGFTGNAVREDTDMSVRVRRKGYTIMYSPEAGLIHFMDNTGGTRTVAPEYYWRTLFKNQCYFYLKNFHYLRLHIMFIQIFDLIRCKKAGQNVLALFRQSYDEALHIAGSRAV
jgi:GT2 family glycosyltransferase